MERMYPRVKKFSNSSASAASYSGFTQCIALAETISKEPYDRQRTFAAAAAGGQLEAVKSYAKVQEGAVRPVCLSVVRWLTVDNLSFPLNARHAAYGVGIHQPQL